MKLKKEDIKIDYFKSSGPGGQHKNKRFTAVRITHLSTGISVVCSKERSQSLNKKIALSRLKEKVLLLSKKRKPRVHVKMPQYLKEKILEGKKKRSERKKLRCKIKLDDIDL